MSFLSDAEGPPRISGWTVLALPEFETRYSKLRDEVRRLKAKLSADKYVEHPTVKLFAAVHRLITSIVPSDPDAPEYWLSGNLSKFRRAKGKGLPPRFRLYWVFSGTVKAIIFLYLNDEDTLRKEGAKKDPYRVFQQMVDRGEIGQDFQSNMEMWEHTHRPPKGR